MSNNQPERLRLILGDQLNVNHAWFRQVDPTALYLIAELPQEVGYARHHVQKVCAFFAAMARFSDALLAAGHRVQYMDLDATRGYTDLPDLLTRVMAEHGITRFEYQLADEYRLLEQLRQYRPPGITVTECDSEHFLVPFSELPSYFTPGKATRLENFYRKLRKRFNILMEEDEPAGGQWNFDADNRNRLKQADLPLLPEPLTFDNDVHDILERLGRNQVRTIGQPREVLAFPVDRDQSLALLRFFCDTCLPNFGRFQDAMTGASPYAWSLYHSRLSFSINAKLLSPREVIDAAVDAWQHRSDIDLAQIEGFVRQILGWREFVRGMYWANMPGYAELNSLGADRDLPDWFWTGETRMACARAAITQSLEHAYAHHIQRLMVTGTFCLIAGIDPDQVDAWYLGIYAEAIEWVEMPNTRGMSQFADGGLVASKPYAAGGNYINRMSDYCKSCHYDVRERSGPGACPLNSLYWHFMASHRERFGKNPRMAMPYRNWDKIAAADRASIIARAEDCLADLDGL